MRREYCKRCGGNRWGVSRQKIRGYETRYCKICAGLYSMKSHKEMRARAIALLGSKCLHCDFSDVRVLEIDHVFGGGRQERMKKTRYAYYRDILAEIDSGKYQLLCANCHAIKGQLNG